MSIVKMGKLTILGVRGDRDKVLNALMRSGATEIVEDKDLDSKIEHGAAFIGNMDMRARLNRAIAGLQKRFPKAKQLSLKKLRVSEEDFTFTEREEEELHALLARYEDLTVEEEACDHAIALLEQDIVQLDPWKDIPVDLSDRNTVYTTSIYGVFRDAATLDSFEADIVRSFPLAMTYLLEEVGVFPAKVSIVTVNEQLPLIRARLASCDFHEIPSLSFTGTAKATIASLRKDIEKKRAELETINRSFEKIADRCGRLMTYHDYLLVRSDQVVAGENIHDLSYTFFLSVWVPANQAKSTGQELADQYDIAWSYRDAEKDEETPVKLKNNPIVRAFEVILEMYGAPSSRETDPMPVLAPFYMILFGMMLSDVGYGALLMAGTAYMLFGRKVEGTVRKMSMMLFISGISAVIWGFVFGGFFGDMVTAVTMGKATFPALWFNPMDSPIKLLIFSMIFGVIHLFFGLGIHIRNEKMKGNLIGGLADSVTWYLIIPGLGLLIGAGAISSDPSTVAILQKVGQWVAIAGASFGLIFAGHGIKNPFKRLIKGLGALYSITSYLSDILSYARVLALVLATSVIATVVNMLGMLVGPSVVGYIVFALIGLFGHTLNLALSALSAFVHTARLQYVEMFGKFFVGGGSFWNPLRRETTYVKIEEDPQPALPVSK
ncbi:MAG TPA: V-type ATPase 116kDa subunit family protein [Clostridia bacterium]|nr:V-type ATPase 116kDa subunit family protein [Clostridia bacterium]